jgi:hypothetical protein
LEAVLWCDRIEIGRGNVSTHVESPAPLTLIFQALLDEDVVFEGIVSKPVQKLVGRLTLFQGISQVLGHRTTT